VAVDRLYLEWQDIGARFLRTANYVATPAAVAAYLTALQNASNAGIQIGTEGTAVFIANSPVDAQYPSALDTAVLLFSTSAGTTVSITVPAPVSSLFAADNLTVSTVGAAALIAAATAAMGDNLGNSIVAFNQGLRSSRRKDQE